MLYKNTPGGIRYYAHAIIPYDVSIGDASSEVRAELRPGATVKGQVLGPEGQIVANASVLTRLCVEPFSPRWRGDYQIPVRDGRFELHGVDPESSTSIHILDAEH